MATTPGLKPPSVWGLWDFIICVALVAVTGAVFWQVGHHEFITYDDPNYVTQNVRVQAGLSRADVAWAYRSRSLCRRPDR